MGGESWLEYQRLFNQPIRSTTLQCPESDPIISVCRFDYDPEDERFSKSEGDLISAIRERKSRQNARFYDMQSPAREGGLREGWPRKKKLGRKKSVTWADESGCDLSKTFATHSPTSYDRTPLFGDTRPTDLNFASFAVVFMMLFVMVIGGSLIHD